MTKLTNFLSRARLAVAAFREYISILVCFLILLYVPDVLRLLDPTAAPIDLGVISAIVLACITLMIAKSVVWGLLKSIWSSLADYSNKFFTADFQSLSPCQRVVIYLSFYLSLVALIAYLVNAYLAAGTR